MNYLKLYEEFGSDEQLYRELDSEGEFGYTKSDKYSTRSKEPITQDEFNQIKSILKKYGVFDATLDFTTTLQKGDKNKFNRTDPDGCRIDVDVTQYRHKYNQIQNAVIVKLQDEYWYVFVDLSDWYTGSYLCDTLKGVDQLIGSFAKKQPTKFSKLKSKIKKFLEN